MEKSTIKIKLKKKEMRVILKIQIFKSTRKEKGAFFKG